MMMLLGINWRISITAFNSSSEPPEITQYYKKILFNLIKNRFSYAYIVGRNKSPDTCVCCRIVSDFFGIFGSLRMGSIFRSKISILIPSRPWVAIEKEILFLFNQSQMAHSLLYQIGKHQP